MTVSATANFNAAGGSAAASTAPPSSSPGMKKRVAFVGKTGAGKSALASLILGRPAFATSGGMKSETKRSQVEESEKYLFVDTQGLLDTEDSQIIVRSNIVEGLKRLGKVDIILLVVHIGRYDKALHEAHSFLVKAILGEEAYNNMIVVLTHAPSNLVRDPIEAQKYIQEQCLPHAHFNDLFRKIRGRVLFVSNPATSSDPDEEIIYKKQRDLSLQHVTKTLDQMDAPPIMNEDLRKAQGKYDEEQKRLEEEQKRLEAEKEAAIIAKGREAAEREFGEKFKILEEQRARSDKMFADQMAALTQAISNMGSGGGGGWFCTIS